MRRFASIRAVVVLLLLTGTLVVASALPALAQPTATVSIRPQATLLARGAAVRVPVRYSCSPDTVFVDLSVQVSQRVGGGRLAQGFGFTSSLLCDGQVHTVRVNVQGSGDNAFRRGVAFAQATLFACDEFACTQVSASREITIGS